MRKEETGGRTESGERGLTTELAEERRSRKIEKRAARLERANGGATISGGHAPVTDIRERGPSFFLLPFFFTFI